MDHNTRVSLRILPLLLLMATIVVAPAPAQDAPDPPTQLPPERPNFDAPETAVPQPVPRPASEPAPVHQTNDGGVDDVEAETESEAEAGKEDDAEVVEGEDEAVIDEEVLEAAAALRRPSFDAAEVRIFEQELREMGAQFEVLEPIGEDEPHCGVERGIRITSLAGIAVEPALEVRCGVALQFAEWAQNVLVPMARLYLDDEPKAIGTSGSYECRWRRGGSGEPVFSQHAFANAIDLASISFEKRKSLQIKPPQESSDEARLFQAAIRGGACAYFTTVLGPMTNAAHADHLHFDMAERRGGYRLCE